MLNRIRLAFRLAWGTLRSRPTLTVLAVLLLALGTAIMGGLLGSVYLLRSLQGEFVSALSVELELVSNTEEIRTQVMSRTEKWPCAEFVQYVPPEVTLSEIQRETSEDLVALFGANPFPAIIRVRFSGITLKTLDSLTGAARHWPGVGEVSYPRRLWDDLETIARRFEGGLGVAAAGLTVLIIGLVGLCFRAQVRNRSAQWEFLLLSGIHPWMVTTSLLFQEMVVGVLGGIAAGAALYGMTLAYSWLFFRTVSLPLWFYAANLLLAVILAVMAGILSPRRFE